MSKTYMVTRITIAHATVEAKNKKEIMELYRNGVVDESLSLDNHKDWTIRIKDIDKDKIIYEHHELGG